MYYNYNKSGMFGSGFPFGGILMPIILIIILDLVLRGMSLWKSARSEQKGWFIALLVLNTLGILPIIYLVFFQKKGKRK